MALKVANRGDVPVFLALQTLRQATALEKTGKEILHLEIGQPFDGAPKAALGKDRKKRKGEQVTHEGPLTPPARRIRERGPWRMRACLRGAQRLRF